MISDTAVIHKNVIFGQNVIVEDYCIIGAIPRGKTDGELETVIGDNAHIRAGSIVYAGNKIGNNFQTGNKANIRELNNIGNNVSIGTLSVIEHHVDIEDNVRIHSQVFIPEYSVLKKNCWVGPSVVFTNARYPKSSSVKEHLAGPVIENHAIIGANSTLLPGVTIGKHSIVGAGSVVTKDIAVGDIVCGNPAKKINSKENLFFYEDK